MNDQFVYCLWTHAELEAFVADQYPWFISTYLAYSYDIQRCDVARYLLLYNYGGTYVDLDVHCYAPLPVILASAPADAGVVVAPTQPFGIATEFIAVRRPRDPIIRAVISGLRRAAVSPWYPPLPYTSVMFRTGPVYLTRRLSCHHDERHVFVIPASKYYGIFVQPGSGGSWHSWDGRLIWKLFQLRRQLISAVLLVAVLLLARVFRIRCLIVKNFHNRFR